MIGTRVAHYRILEKLGEGGMGVVYKAEDTKLHRTVALKFLPPDVLATDDEKDRFVREARAAAALDHPNISTIYEINDDDSEMYISMAFIDGPSLKETIDRGPMKIDRALNIAVQVAEGLKAAHAKTIVHRDIKSANIMITEAGQAKIMDFGLAKLIGTRDPKERSTMGTVAYMSPEQTRGDEVDERSDIWSLGVVMYEMVAGLRPFRGDYDQSVIYAIVNEEPEPLTALRTGVPMELERIVCKALAKKPKNRYQRVEDLIDDLKALRSDLDSRELLARGGIRVGPRRRVGIYAVSTIILAVAVAIVLGAYMRSGQREAESAQIPIAVADFDNTNRGRDAGWSVRDVDYGSRAVAAVVGAHTRSSMFDVLQQMGRHDVDHIDEQLGREVCAEANVRVLVVASIRKFDELYTIDLKAYEMGRPAHLFTAREEGTGRASIPGMIDRIAQKTRKGLKENTAHIQRTRERVADVTTPNLEAYQEFFRGEQLIDKLEFEKARKTYQTAIELDSTFALAHYRLAYANWWGGESEEIQRAQLQKAMAHVDRLPEKFRFLLRAQIAVKEDGYEQGIEVLKAMELIYPDDKEMIYNIGDFSLHAKQFEQAEEYLLSFLAMEPNSQRALQHLMMTYNATGETEKAIGMGERYVESSQTDHAYITLSQTYASEGDLDGALEVMEKARTMMPDNPWVRRRIAVVRCMNDEFAVARSMLDSLVTGTEDTHVKREVYGSLQGANLYMGRYREALEATDHSLVLAEADQDTVAVVFGHQMKGIIHLFGWNDRESAAAEFDKARALQEVADPDRFGERAQDYWANLMAYYFLTGEPERARAIAENRLKDDAPQYDRYRFFRLWAAGDYDGAQGVVGDILVDERKYDKTPVLYYLAKSQMEHGDYEEALEIIQELQEGRHYGGARPIFYAPSYYLLGQTFEQKGDTKSAIESYEKFLVLWSEADPDLPILRDAKARLAKLTSSSTQ